MPPLSTVPEPSTASTTPACSQCRWPVPQPLLVQSAVRTARCPKCRTRLGDVVRAHLSAAAETAAEVAQRNETFSQRLSRRSGVPRPLLAFIAVAIVGAAAILGMVWLEHQAAADHANKLRQRRAFVRNYRAELTDVLSRAKAINRTTPTRTMANVLDELAYLVDSPPTDSESVTGLDDQIAEAEVEQKRVFRLYSANGGRD